MITRRRFLQQVGAAGGFGAAFVTMQAMGLLPQALAYDGPPALPQGAGDGISVIILGAGLAGLTACYELEKAGYDCTLLEARDRIGGRCWTIRNGDRVEETDQGPQTCEFEDGLYFNAGPARIPSQHRALLSYCKQFNVPLEVFVSSNRSGLFQDDAAFEGNPLQARQLHFDAAGHISELLAKAVDRGALDEALDRWDRRRLRFFLIQYGALDRDLTYRGSSRSGYDRLPGAGGEAGTVRPPLDVKALLNSRFWQWHMNFEQRFEQQATMLQPVGGMDQIPRAFARHIKAPIRLGRIVLEIGRGSKSVRILHQGNRQNDTKVSEADYCICTLPLTVLNNLVSDFSPAFKQAIGAGAQGYQPACKLAWEARRRVWEDDEGIYGGISWTQREITQLWYPSNDFHSPRGILIGAYNFSGQASAFGRLDPVERARVARESGSRLHPQLRTEVGKPISVAWQKVPFSMGAYASWNRFGKEEAYQRLNQPDGRVYLAGEHLSHWTSWQEGAVLSAHHAIAALNERVVGSGR